MSELIEFIVEMGWYVVVDGIVELVSWCRQKG